MRLDEFDRHREFVDHHGYGPAKSHDKYRTGVPAENSTMAAVTAHDLRPAGGDDEMDGMTVTAYMAKGKNVEDAPFPPTKPP